MGVVLFLYRTAVDFDIIETKVSEKSKTLYHIIELLQDRLHLLALYCEFNIGDIVSIPPSPLVLEKNFTYHDIVKSTETLVKDVYEEIRNHPAFCGTAYLYFDHNSVISLCIRETCAKYSLIPVISETVEFMETKWRGGVRMVPKHRRFVPLSY